MTKNKVSYFQSTEDFQCALHAVIMTPQGVKCMILFYLFID